MSVFTRLWNFIRRPTGYVGKDLQGNYFYEHASTTNDPRRTRRVVKYKGQTDTLAVANRSRLLAARIEMQGRTVQWKAWLTHTRLHPPSLEELQADVARQERLRYNVALIEARDREERLRLAAGAGVVGDTQYGHEHRHTERQAVSAPRGGRPAHDGRTQADSGLASPGSDGLQAGEERERPGDAGASATVKPEVQTGMNEQQQQQRQQNQRQYEHDPWVPRPASDEPQAWAPRAVQRGG